MRHKSIKEVIGGNFTDFTRNTSIHGLRYLCDPEIFIWEKLFWTVVLICVTFSALYLTSLHLKRFADDPMRTTIITNYAPTDAVPFPAVTICDTNRIHESKMYSFIKKLDLVNDNEELLQRAIPQLIGFFRPATINDTDLIKIKHILDRNDYLYTDLILRKMGSVCEEILIQCKWNEEIVNCMSLFEETYTLDGLCCTFNYFDRSRQNSKPNKTTSTGWRSGLMLTMNPMLETIEHSSIHSSGVKVHIHNSFEYPAYGTTSKIASPGHTYFFQVTATKLINTEKVQDLTRGERQCVFTDEHSLTYHKHYYFSNCMVENYANNLYKICGCVLYYHTFSDKPKCNITDIPCIQTYFKDYGTMNSDANCPAKCDWVVYGVRPTSTRLNNVSKALTKENQHKIPERDGIRVNIFFIKSHTIISRDVYTTDLNLISSIGGIYSSFMGCSIITILEMIYYCSLRIFINLGWLGKSRKKLKGKANHRPGVVQTDHRVYRIYNERYIGLTFKRHC